MTLNKLERRNGRYFALFTKIKMRISGILLACITLNGLSVLVFLLTDLLFDVPPSSDQFLNTARLSGTTT